MTDWNEIIANIQHAIDAVDETQRASEKLRTNPTPETIDEFHQEAEALCKRLKMMNSILKEGSAFPIEELTEQLSHIFIGNPKTYRKTAGYQQKAITPKTD